MNNQKNDDPENGNSQSLGDIVEAAVFETRTFFLNQNVRLNPKHESKIVRWLFEEIKEHGSMSEDSRQRFFDALIKT